MADAASRGAELQPPAATDGEVRPWWRLRFSPPNPFYLLSAAFFLHATGVWAQQQGRELPDAVRMALIGGYLTMMAGTALLIVRLWKQWNDARSILLIVLLLFAELALTFDDALLRDPRQGALLIAAGLGIAIAVSEVLLRGLQMRFPARFRIPYYVQLTLIILYPLVLAGPARGGDRTAVTERLYGFSWIAAASLLLLIPAIRLRNRGMENTGTPWKWPMYPWPAFVFLGLCLVARSFAQCLSFDSVSMVDLRTAVDGLPSIFGPHFVAPFLLAVGVLVYVAGDTAGNLRLRNAALLIFPVVATAASFPGVGDNAAYREFVATLVARWAAPPILTLVASACGFALAAVRGDRAARLGLCAVVIAMSVISPETINLASLRWPPPALTLAALGLALVAVSWMRRRSVDFVLGVTVLTAALWSLGALRSRIVPEAILAEHLIFAAVLVAAIAFHDRWNDVWRWTAAAMIVLMGTAATTGIQGSRAILLTYTVNLVILMLAAAWLVRDLRFATVALYCVGLVEVNAVWLSYDLLLTYTQWRGTLQFVFALGLFLAGVQVSAWKGGALESASTLFVRRQRVP